MRFLVSFEVAVADGAQLDELEREVSLMPGVIVLRADRESLDPVEPRVLDRLEEAELVRGPRAEVWRDRCRHTRPYGDDPGDYSDFSDGGDVPY